MLGVVPAHERLGAGHLAGCGGRRTACRPAAAGRARALRRGRCGTRGAWWRPAASPGRRSGSDPCRPASPRTSRCRRRAAGWSCSCPAMATATPDAGEHGHVVAGDRDRARAGCRAAARRRRSLGRCRRGPRAGSRTRRRRAAPRCRPVPAARRMRSATVLSSWSPTAWPSASLTDLKSSRSTNSTTTGSASGRVTRSAWSMRSRNSARLASPVSSSWNARWLSWRSRLRCSVTSRNVATMPSTAAPPTRLATTTVALRCWPSACSQRGLELDGAAVAELDQPFELTHRALRVRPSTTTSSRWRPDPTLGVVSRASPAGPGWRS